LTKSEEAEAFIRAIPLETEAELLGKEVYFEVPFRVAFENLDERVNWVMLLGCILKSKGGTWAQKGEVGLNLRICAEIDGRAGYGSELAVLPLKIRPFFLRIEAESLSSKETNKKS